MSRGRRFGSTTTRRWPEGTADDLVRSGVGAPITVGGRLWGMIAVSSRRAGSLAPDTEARLTAFTELAATAIANAQAQADLAASRARIVASADETRRRIERDLHDGAQAQLVTLAAAGAGGASAGGAR